MNAPSTFQRILDYVLKDVTMARVYLNDIVIFSNSMEEHIDHLTAIFNAAGLKLKNTKRVFAVKGVRFLGHSVDKIGVGIGGKD